MLSKDVKNKKNVLLNWHQKLTLKVKILVLFDTSPLHQFLKSIYFLWVCWFLGRQKSFQFCIPPSPPWKLDNLYCHISGSFPKNEEINDIQIIIHGQDDLGIFTNVLTPFVISQPQWVQSPAEEFMERLWAFKRINYLLGTYIL